MRVLILSKASIVGQYQTKLTTLAAQDDLELTVVVPPSWQDERGTIPLEKKHTEGYELIVAPIRFNGHFHIHYYPTLPQILARVQPHILHIDEEPYNFATYHAARHMRRLNARSSPHALSAAYTHILFFSWQNILRRYPPPFSLFEKYIFNTADAAIAGNQEAKNILTTKGFAKPICVIPQFGVPDSFSPSPSAANVPAQRPHSPIMIGYAGRLVREKGIQVLLNALVQVQGDWVLKILGSGPLSNTLPTLAQSLHIGDRVHFSPWVSSGEMPNFYNSLDILVVPSLTQPNWKEQFGRVIMEAMACGVPVIGSDSGEIPNVIGDAGIIVPEGDIPALTRALDTLIQNPNHRQALGAQGRTRARSLFSQQRVVDDTYNLYLRLLKSS